MEPGIHLTAPDHVDDGSARRYVSAQLHVFDDHGTVERGTNHGPHGSLGTLFDRGTTSRICQGPMLGMTNLR